MNGRRLRPHREPVIDVDTRSRDERAPTGRGIVETVGAVAASTTLLTGIAYYFGWVFSNARTSYFGIDHSIIGFTTRDYLLRSADGLFVPFGTIMVGLLGALAIHAFVSRRVQERWRPTALRITACVAGLLGCLVFMVGAYAVFRPIPVAVGYLVPPACLGCGVGAAGYAAYVLRALRVAAGHRRATWAAWEVAAATVTVLIMALSLFWGSSSYAGALGRGRAIALAANLDGRPGVVVYARRSLAIDGPGVVETRLSNPDSLYRYRYVGLRLFVRSSGKYFLLPDRWTVGDGAVIVLEDTSEIRIELKTAGG